MVKRKVNIERLKKFHSKGMDDVTLAVNLRTSVTSVRYYRNKLGLSVNKPGITDVSLDNFHKLYMDGTSDAVIANELSISPWKVRKLREKFGYDSHNIKRIDYKSVRELYDQGYTDLAIANTLDICSVTVGKWRKSNHLPIVNTQYRNMIMSREINNKKLKELAERDAVTPKVIDPESLYHDTQFLETLMQRNLDKESLFTDKRFVEGLMRKKVSN